MDYFDDDEFFHHMDAIPTSPATQARKLYKYNRNKKKLSPEQRSEISKRLVNGEKVAALAAEYGFSKTTIVTILNRGV